MVFEGIGDSPEETLRVDASAASHRVRGSGIGDWGSGIGDRLRWGPLWGTRGPHSPKGVGIRGEGVTGIGDWVLVRLR
ncbi:hypothetical protein BLD44_013005 [Mastigocladus laminosus UU774]|nr:hypothetical protein BLD44_013005 [Mastigocladus laminosus UU774]